MRLIAITVNLALAASAAAAPPDLATFDRDLCARAQRYLVNADSLPSDAFAIHVLRGEGNGFHTIQMDVDRASRTVVVAASEGHVRVDGADLATHVACKMVDRDRVNDVLGLSLSGPERSCRDVNEATYAAALASLTDDERRRYEATARPLSFAPDRVLATGGEWLPAAIEDFIGPGGENKGLEIAAPSVRVPWNAEERNFFQGTRHCKLITLAAMRRWMLTGAAAGDKELFPRNERTCRAPSSPTSTVGSCRFWFAPAGTTFCEDYSGREWSTETARSECGKRHASAQALSEAKNRYEGKGGLFSPLACDARDDAGALAGTCVFHCGQGDEVLWRVPAAAPAGGPAMSRACDLFIP